MSNIGIVHELRDRPISTMKTKLLACRAHAYVPFSICLVPPSIRKADPTAYQPKIISVGPYHLQNPNLPDMGDLKWRYMNNLLDRNYDISTEVLLEKCIEEVSKKEARARECYQVSLSLSSSDFVMMLVLDGCFILQLLLTSFYRPVSEDDSVYSIAWMFPSIWEDLLKLENQIPFFILEDLFNIIVASEMTDYLSVKGLTFYFFRERAPPFVTSDDLESEDVSHLLHFFYILHRPHEYYDEDTSTSRTPPFCLPSILQSIYERLMSLITQPKMTTSMEKPPTKVACVVELCEAGIKFRQKTDPKSILDVTYEDGALFVPQLVVNNSTNSILRNLMAFEQFCPNRDNYIVQYVMFLDYIIKTPKDVIQLQQCNIIHNLLGSEDDVALIFKQLGRDVTLDYSRPHYLGKVFQEAYKGVNKYVDSKWRKHRTTCVRDYFSSPWTILSVLAAIAIILMTVVQVTFAVLSYQKQL